MILDWILLIILFVYTAVELVVFVETADSLWLHPALLLFPLFGIFAFGMHTVFIPAYNYIHHLLPPGSYFAKSLVSGAAVLAAVIGIYVTIAIAACLVMRFWRSLTKKLRPTTSMEPSDSFVMIGKEMTPDSHIASNQKRPQRAKS